MSLAALATEVVARPNAEDAREAYAEAIEATDPERAELIRLQLKMARTRRAGLDDTPELARNAELVEANGSRWAQQISQYVSDYWFIRGFVELVTVDARRFLEAADELYALAPILHLNITDAMPAAGDLFRSEPMDRIQSLSLAQSGLGDAGAIAIAESPCLRSLEWLDLSSNDIGAVGLEALAASTNLPKLGYLNFSYNAIADPTPQQCDDYDYTSAAAHTLMEKYGHRVWLDAHPRWLWPPERDAIWISFA